MSNLETFPLTEQQRQRIRTLESLREAGIDPYPPRSERSHTTEQAKKAFLAVEEQTRAAPVEATVAGRLMSVRVMGRLTFAHIEDGEGRLQLLLRKNQLGADSYELFRRRIDLGDFVQASGTMMRTRTGEITLEVTSWKLLAKALSPPPEKWHGLRDVEIRYRRRYVDLAVNPAVREIFRTRSQIVTAVRRYMDDRGFLEVETPILQPLYGGAAARPFVTHHNALDTDLYLRIADELYLKRLIAGGLERVYEIGKDFRNEGISTRHNPEFTQLEAYQAYADYYDIMELVEGCWSTVAEEVLGSTILTYQEHTVDLKPPWRRLPMRDAILETAGVDIDADRDYETLWARISERKLQVEPKPTWGQVVDELFKEYVEPTLIEPTFLLDYPVEISPLAKRKPSAPHLTERFEFFIAGLELGNAFTELNDPLDQLARFQDQRKAQISGDEEAHPLDEDWIQALMFGMPPTGGVGWGIDRMTMLFTNQSSIREVILFPQLRKKD
jgi:lysyl-tRNA synthetase class 2